MAGTTLLVKSSRWFSTGPVLPQEDPISPTSSCGPSWMASSAAVRQRAGSRLTPGSGGGCGRPRGWIGGTHLPSSQGATSRAAARPLSRTICAGPLLQPPTAGRAWTWSAHFCSARLSTAAPTGLHRPNPAPCRHPPPSTSCTATTSASCPTARARTCYVVSRPVDPTPKGAAVFTHAILLDGRLIGHWRPVARKGAVTIDTHFHRPLRVVERVALEAAADRYSRFVGSPVTLKS